METPQKIHNDCVICYDPIIRRKDITFANCSHGSYVHRICITRSNEKCPLCRSTIYNRKHTFDNIINNTNDN